MKAVVLVGGEGTRLRPLTLSTPKPLLPIANVAFLERQLSWLASHGVTEVVLSLGYLPNKFEEHFGTDSFAGMRLRYAVEDRPLGTAGGIRFAAGDTDERIVVCNGDVLTDLDLAGFVRFHDEVGAEASIALTRVDDPSAFGVVPTRDDGSVIAFVEKPPPGSAPTDWINAGTYVLEPSVLNRIPERLQVSIEREVFPRMLEGGGRLYALRSDSYWIDIGTPDKYLAANRDVLSGAVGTSVMPDARETAPGLWCAAEVSVHENAIVDPPVALARGVRISAGARVAASSLGAGVVLGARARVIRSVVHAGASLGSDIEVVDSVVGPGAVLEDGVRIAKASIVGAGVRVEAGEQVLGGRLASEAV